MSARKTTGSARFHLGKWRARVTLGKAQVEITLPAFGEKDEKKARERTALLAEMARRLTDAARTDVARPLLERAAKAEGKALSDVVEASRRLASGAAVPVSTLATFREFGEKWTSGELHRRYPDHVKAIGQDDNRERLRKYVYPFVGDVALTAFTLDHADAVMSALPETLSRATRRHVAMAMSRVLTLAAFPGRLITANPLPKGYLPTVGKPKAMTYLYPDEDGRLLATTTIALSSRLLYGFLVREGMRRSEAGRMTWGDLDLVRGSVRLDENKTDDPRAWSLDPGVGRALAAWRVLLGEPPRSALVFVDGEGEPLVREDDSRLILRFREDLSEAGIDRPELFERSEARQPIRVHDLRASFITIALASGRSETWVSDRTGHKSSAMINRYRRAARHAEELGLGTFAPLDEAIPELRGVAIGDLGKDLGKGSASLPRPDAPASSKRPSFVGDSRGGTRTLKPLRTADFESQRAVVNGREPSETVGNERRSKRSATSFPSSGASFPRKGRAPTASSETPRGRTVLALSGLLAEAVGVGDVATARALYGSLGALLAAPPSGNGAEVVDLASRRKS